MHDAHAHVTHVSMAGFKFNFVLPESNHPNSLPSQQDHPSFLPSSTVATTVSPPLSAGQTNHHNLKKVTIQSFHNELLSFISPMNYSVTHSPLSPFSPSPLPPSLHNHTPDTSVTLIHYVTLNRLKSILKSTEHDLSLKSDNNVFSRLTTELGTLIGITDSMHSDLIPDVYEGGMKIWECAYDLVNYLAMENSIPMHGRRILELGCGVGLPGILALMCGADYVHFHDYNHQVLNCLTIPSVLANFEIGQPGLKMGLTYHTTVQTELESRTKFYFGDWLDFAMSHNSSGGIPYDIILTSETIYSISSQPKLLTTLKKLTNQNSRDSVVVMAAKMNYFGVGGSVAMFQDLVAKDGHFEFKIVKRIEASVPRVIMLLTPHT